MNYVQGEDLFGGQGLEQALASGYARQGGIREGRTEGWAGATQAANRRVVEDSPSAWLLVDSETGAVRANSAKQLFERHRPAMEGDFRVATPAEFSRGSAWKRTIGAGTKAKLGQEFGTPDYAFHKLGGEGSGLYLAHMPSNRPPYQRAGGRMALE